MVGSDYVQACAVHLQPRLADFLNLAAKQLGHEAKENVSVANNACWAIGEVAVKVKQDIAPIVVNVISCLVPILSNTEVCNRV
jgi:transportin-1